MKELLSRAGAPFVVKNVEIDFDAYDELMALGFRAVPVTIIGGDPATRVAIKGDDEATITAALARVSPPSPDR